MLDRRCPLMRRLARSGALFIASAIVVLSISPSELRPVVASHSLEHITIYLALGLSAGLAYLPRFAVSICFFLVLFCVTIEVLQLGIPGRHARLEDLALDVIASQVGFVLAGLFLRFGTGRS